MVKFAKTTKFGLIDTCPKRSVLQYNPHEQNGDKNNNIVYLYESKKIELILEEKRIRFQDPTESFDVKLGCGDFRKFSYHYLKNLGIEEEILNEVIEKGFSGEFFYHQSDKFTLCSKVISPFN